MPRSDAARRRYKAAWQRLWRERRRATHCPRCGRPSMPDCRKCARCVALLLESAHPDLEHDTRSHALWIIECRRPSQRCAGSGYTLLELESIGQRLQVDRIDPALGYVVSNMQLLCAYLNRLKSRHNLWPAWALDELALRLVPPSAEARIYGALARRA